MLIDFCPLNENFGTSEPKQVPALSDYVTPLALSPADHHLSIVLSASYSAVVGPSMQIKSKMFCISV